jgi:hypothetical protein
MPGFVGKLRRFRLFPLHSLTIKLGLAQVLHARRTARAKDWVERNGFAPLTRGQAEGALPQDPADLRYLYEAITRHRPARTIEFGSGQSTVFIAQALHDIGRGQLWSLDADADWLEHTRSLLPQHLRPYVTLVHSPVIVNREFGMPVWEYTIIPEGEWDFVMLDGPCGKDGITASCDLIKLAPKLRPGARGFIDHRWRTANLAVEHAGERLGLRYMPSLESYAIEAR